MTHPATTFLPSLVPGYLIEVMTAAQAQTRTRKLRALGARFTTRTRPDGRVSVEYHSRHRDAAAHDYAGAARHRAAAEAKR